VEKYLVMVFIPKNVMAGEGGAIVINGDNHLERAEIIREKGTDRSKFFRGATIH